MDFINEGNSKSSQLEAQIQKARTGEKRKNQSFLSFLPYTYIQIAAFIRQLEGEIIFLPFEILTIPVFRGRLV